MTDFYIKEGDLLPKIEATLKDETDTAVDLTDSTVKFKMNAHNDPTAKVDAAATIDDALNGKVSYTWIAADTDTPGAYDAEFEVTFPSTKVLTFPNNGYLKIQVVADLS